jgi:hypothetical protein
MCDGGTNHRQCNIEGGSIASCALRNMMRIGCSDRLSVAYATYYLCVRFIDPTIRYIRKTVSGQDASSET